MKPNNEKLPESDIEYLVVMGKTIAAMRKKKGYSQLDLSLEAGVAKSYLAELEVGKRNPTIASLRKLALALGCDVRALLPH